MYVPDAAPLGSYAPLMDPLPPPPHAAIQPSRKRRIPASARRARARLPREVPAANSVLRRIKAISQGSGRRMPKCGLAGGSRLGRAEEPDAVLTVTVVVMGPAPFSVRLVGENTHEALDGRLLQLKATVPVNPFWGVTVTVYVVVPPEATVAEEGVAEMLKSAPVPAMVTVCGLLAVLSVIDKVAVCVPPAEGKKVTLIVQLFPEVREFGHALISVKLGLERAMLAIFKVALPALVSVTG